MSGIGTPFDRQHRGSQGDADLPVTLTVIIAPTLTIAAIALGHWRGWW